MGKLNLGTLVVDVVANTAAFERDLQRADKKIVAFSRRFQKIGERLKRVGLKMSLAISAPFAIFSGYAIKALSDFDSAMTESTAIIGDMTGKMRKSMESVATTMGQELAFGAKDAAEGFYYLFSAGMDVNQSLQTMDEVMQFARAGAFDLATATELATDAQSAMGMKVQNVVKNEENLARVTDVLLKATTLADATTEQFAMSLSNQAGAVARGFGISIEETTALLSAFADQGQKGRRAGTRLAIALEQMVRGAEENKEVWKKYGVEMFDAQGNLRAMADVVEDLEEALGPMSDEMRATTMKEMGFQVKSQRVVKMLIGMSDRIRDWHYELKQAGGTTERVANDQMKALGKQFKQAFIAVTNLTKSFAKEFEPQIRGVIDKVEDLANKLKEIPSEKKINFVVKGAALASIGPLLFGLGMISHTIAIVGKGLAKISFGFKSLLKLAWSIAKPITLVVGAIVAIVGSVNTLRHQFDWIDKLADAFMDKFKIIGKIIKDWTKYILDFKDEVDMLFTVFTEAPDLAFKIMVAQLEKWLTIGSKYIENFLAQVFLYFKKFYENTASNFKKLGNWIKNAWVAVIEKNKKISAAGWKSIASFVVEAMLSGFNIIARQWQDLQEFISDPLNWKKGWEAATPIDDVFEQIDKLEMKGQKAMNKVSDDLDIDPIEIKPFVPEEVEPIALDLGVDEATKEVSERLKKLTDKLVHLFKGKGVEEPDWLAGLSGIMKQVTEGLDVSNLREAGDAVKDGADRLNEAAEKIRVAFYSAKGYWKEAQKAALRPLEKEKGKTEEATEAFVNKQIKVAEQLAEHLSGIQSIQKIIARTSMPDVRKVLAAQLDEKFPDLSEKQLLDILKEYFISIAEKEEETKAKTRRMLGWDPRKSPIEQYERAWGSAPAPDEKQDERTVYGKPLGVMKSLPPLLQTAYGGESLPGGGTQFVPPETKQNAASNKQTAKNTKETMQAIIEMKNTLQESSGISVFK